MPRIKLVLLRLATTGALAAGCASIGATPALAGPITVNKCTSPVLSQPFVPFGDANYYFLVPGEKPGSFSGSSWTLSGGASIVKTTMPDGTTGSVLDLPSGSEAVSPTVCVSSDYPTARTMVRNVVGSEGVFFYVSYENTPTWVTPKNTGQVHGTGTAWTLSDPVNVQPSSVAGWQLARFVFIPGGTTSDFQIYNFYVDPYSKG